MVTVPGEAISASEQDVRAALAKVLGSQGFQRSPKLTRLLSFLVEQTLAGSSGWIKETTIAVEVFDQPADFNPRSNPIVRVNASRLRNLLRLYYSDAGRDDPVQIQLAAVGYVPEFHVTDAGLADEEPPARPAGEGGSGVRAANALAPLFRGTSLHGAAAKEQENGNEAAGRKGFLATVTGPASTALLIGNLAVAITFAAIHGRFLFEQVLPTQEASSLRQANAGSAGSILLLCHPGEASALSPESSGIVVRILGKSALCQPILQSAATETAGFPR